MTAACTAPHCSRELRHHELASAQQLCDPCIHRARDILRSIPAALTVLPKAAGSDTTVCLMTWATGAIRNKWLEVTVKSDVKSGLTRPDVFYFGSLVGETGDEANLRVTSADLLAVRRALGTPAAIDSRLDFDRSGTINAIDLVACRDNFGRALSPLPASAAAAPLEAERAHALLL